MVRLRVTVNGVAHADEVAPRTLQVAGRIKGLAARRFEQRLRRLLGEPDGVTQISFVSRTMRELARSPAELLG